MTVFECEAVNALTGMDTPCCDTCHNRLEQVLEMDAFSGYDVKVNGEWYVVCCNIDAALLMEYGKSLVNVEPINAD